MTSLSVFFGLLITVSNFSSTTVTAPPPATFGSEIVMTQAQEELRFAELVNTERENRGLKPLVYDAQLVEVARTHSREMSDKHYFAHDSPTPGLKTAMDRYLHSLTQLPSWALVGENLFYCSIVDVDRGHNAFMNSEGHRANILESRFERIGVGIYTNSNGEFYVTQMFLARTD